MSAVRYGQSGYIGTSKSVRASIAEHDELLPLTRAAKATGISAARIKAHIEPTEWHHTGAYANRTDYYDTAEIARRFAPGGDLEHAPAPTVDSSTLTLAYQTVRWTEWRGQGRTKRPVQHEAPGCTVTISKQTATITLPTGETFKKRLSTIGFFYSPDEISA